MEQLQTELQEFMGGDAAIANAAWTSSLDYQKKKTKSEEDIKRVVNMLADLKHSTPFESVVMRFWIRMPIAIDRQFMTHRLQSPSGMSGRYRTMPSEYLDMPEDVKSICDKITEHTNNSVGYTLENRDIIYGIYDLQEVYYRTCEEANCMYKNSILIAKDLEKQNLLTNKEFKRFREFMRGMLPQHNMTERVTTMNLRSFANFQKLRNSEHAQEEIKYIAELMLKEVKNKNVAPIAIECLERNGWNI